MSYWNGKDGRLSFYYWITAVKNAWKNPWCYCEYFPLLLVLRIYNDGLHKMVTSFEWFTIFFWNKIFFEIYWLVSFKFLKMSIFTEFLMTFDAGLYIQSYYNLFNNHFWESGGALAHLSLSKWRSFYLFSENKPLNNLSWLYESIWKEYRAAPIVAIIEIKNRIILIFYLISKSKKSRMLVPLPIFHNLKFLDLSVVR